MKVSMNHKHYRRMLQDSIDEINEINENNGNSSSLEKTSKNVKAQKKKLFGTSGNPAPKSPKGQAQMEALKDFAQRRYGLEIVPSKGKYDEKKGQYRKKDAKVGTSKPDWRGEKGNQISSQSNSGAQSHELGHLEQMPIGREAKEHQTIMDQEVGESVKTGGGPTTSFKHPSEVQARAAENPLRRRAGLPPHTPTVAVNEGDKERIVLGTESDPAAVRRPDKKGGMVDQLKSGKLLNRPNQERMQDIDEGILTYDHSKGWQRSSDPNALINMRAQGRYDEATERAQKRYKPAPNQNNNLVDFQSLSPEDHEAIQDFLKQRKNKLAASEDVSDPYDIGAAMKKSRTGVSDTLGAPHPNTQQKGVNRPKQVYSSHDRNPAIANQGVSEAGHWARSKSNGDSAKNVHTRTLNELRSMPKPNLPKSEEISDPMGIGSALKKAAANKKPTDQQMIQEKPASTEYHEKSKKYLAEKAKLGKNEGTSNKLSSPHILFSMQNSVYGKHKDADHDSMVKTLKGMGADVEEVYGSYGNKPEKSILVINPSRDISTAIHYLATKNGQESVLHSDGKNHELHFLNGEMKGKHVKGSGTDYHSETPQTNYSKLPDGTVFSHKLDFNQIHGE